MTARRRCRRWPECECIFPASERACQSHDDLVVLRDVYRWLGERVPRAILRRLGDTKRVRKV